MLSGAAARTAQLPGTQYSGRLCQCRQGSGKKNPEPLSKAHLSTLRKKRNTRTRIMPMLETIWQRLVCRCLGCRTETKQSKRVQPELTPITQGKVSNAYARLVVIMLYVQSKAALLSFWCHKLRCIRLPWFTSSLSSFYQPIECEHRCGKIVSCHNK